MMKHFKINVDRKKLSSEHIQSRQDFSSVLNGAKLSKPSVSIWKTTWFYGVVGMAGVATVVGYYFNETEKNVDETIITKTEQVNKEIDFRMSQQLAMEDVTLLAVNQPQQNVKENNVMTTKMVSFSNEKPEKPIITTIQIIEKEVEAKPIAVEETTKIPVVAQKKPAKSNMPSVSGVYNGDISWENFKEGEVFVGEDLSVKQFSIQYTTRMGDRTISVKGNKIPNEVVTDLEKLGLDQTIFITNVIAGDTSGELMRFVSMDLNVKFK